MTAIKKTQRKSDPVSKKALVFIASSTCLLVIGWNMYRSRSQLASIVHKIEKYRNDSLIATQSDKLLQSTQLNTIPVATPTSGPKIVEILPTQTSEQSRDTEPWGVAQKVDDVTYSIKVGYDSKMATPEEVFVALNTYRTTKGSQALAWSDTLASYALQRALYFDSIKGTDKHAGFNTYLNEQDGFNQLRFNRLGENSFFGGPLSGTHVIEWVFSQSPGHNSNQLDTGWTHVGVGTSPTAINLIFGSGEF